MSKKREYKKSDLLSQLILDIIDIINKNVSSQYNVRIGKSDIINITINPNNDQIKLSLFKGIKNNINYSNIFNSINKSKTIKDLDNYFKDKIFQGKYNYYQFGNILEYLNVFDNDSNSIILPFKEIDYISYFDTLPEDILMVLLSDLNNTTLNQMRLGFDNLISDNMVNRLFNYKYPIIFNKLKSIYEDLSNEEKKDYNFYTVYLEFNNVISGHKFGGTMKDITLNNYSDVYQYSMRENIPIRILLKYNYPIVYEKIKNLPNFQKIAREIVFFMSSRKNKENKVKNFINTGKYEGIFDITELPVTIDLNLLEFIISQKDIIIKSEDYIKIIKPILANEDLYKIYLSKLVIIQIANIFNNLGRMDQINFNIITYINSLSDENDKRIFYSNVNSNIMNMFLQRIATKPSYKTISDNYNKYKNIY